MSYRPICDRWIFARAKLKPFPDGTKRTYYGSYLAGFPERARIILGATLSEPVLHVCGGMAQFYPYSRGFGVNDKTMDMDPNCQPDFLMDAREKVWPMGFQLTELGNATTPITLNWRAILMDPPYNEFHAGKYAPGASAYPNPNELVRTAINHVPIGHKVGIIHFKWPRCPKNAKEIASITVSSGRDNQERVFVAYERIG